MRKTTFIVLTLIAIITGCKVDEAGFPEKSTPDKLLVGKWFVKSLLFSASIDGTEIGTNTNEGYTAKDYYIFNADNTYSVSQSVITVVSTGNYSYSSTSAGKKIVMGAGNGYPGITFTISKLTADSLVLVNSTTITANGSTSTTNSTYKFAHQ